MDEHILQSVIVSFSVPKIVIVSFSVPKIMIVSFGPPFQLGTKEEKTNSLSAALASMKC